jgi:hypothetical protein
MKITPKYLRSLHACAEHVDIFREAFPRGLSVTGPSGAPRAQRAIARVAAAGLDFGWFADHAGLSPVARDVHDRAVAAARDAYDRNIAPARDAYDRAVAAAGDVYNHDRTVKAARDAYYRAIEAAGDAYDRAGAAARDAYARAIAEPPAPTPQE